MVRSGLGFVSLKRTHTLSHTDTQTDYCTSSVSETVWLKKSFERHVDWNTEQGKHDMGERQREAERWVRQWNMTVLLEVPKYQLTLRVYMCTGRVRAHGKLILCCLNTWLSIMCVRGCLHVHNVPPCYLIPSGSILIKFNVWPIKIITAQNLDWRNLMEV